MSFMEKQAINRSIGRRLVIYDLRKYLGREKGISGHEITNKARLMPDLCDCMSPKPPTKEVICRWSAVEPCMFSTLGMLNDMSKPVMTLRFLTAS